VHLRLLVLVKNLQISGEDEDEMMMGVERIRLSMPRTATSTKGRQPVSRVPPLLPLLSMLLSLA